MSRPALFALIAVVGLTFTGGAAADEAADRLTAARALQETMNLKAQIPKMVEALGGTFSNIFSQLNPGHNVEISKLVQEEVGAQIAPLLPDLIEATARIYAQNYSVDELHQLDAFYRTEIGRKVLELQPQDRSRSARRRHEDRPARSRSRYTAHPAEAARTRAEGAERHVKTSFLFAAVLAALALQAHAADAPAGKPTDLTAIDIAPGLNQIRASRKTTVRARAESLARERQCARLFRLSDHQRGRRRAGSLESGADHGADTMERPGHADRRAACVRRHCAQRAVRAGQDRQ